VLNTSRESPSDFFPAYFSGGRRYSKNRMHLRG